MKMRIACWIAAFLGVLCGLGATYPFLLGPLPSFILWGIGGMLAGGFAHTKKNVIWIGIIYGVVLSFAFLFSRFGGTSENLLAYTAFVAAMSLVGAIGGILTAFIGWSLKRSLKKS